MILKVVTSVSIFDFLTKFFNVIARGKVYLARSSAYVAIGNFLMLLATFKISYGINLSAFIIVPVGFVLAVLVGWLDYKLLMRRETVHVNKQNDIKRQLDELSVKLDRLKNEM